MISKEQEIKVSEAFSKQSVIFDAIDIENDIIGWIRTRVRKEVLSYLSANDHILELNCGTGIDSIFFAENGYKVFATDNAEGMLAMLGKKTKEKNLEQKIDIQRCSFNNLPALGDKKFDYIFSNFGGLNCAEDLSKVLADADKLLKPGGYMTLVIMPVVCPWEMIMLFKGYFKTAFRRFRINGTSARVEDVNFTCYYYSPGYVRNALKGYKQVSLKGISIVVPPPFIEHFVARHPKIFSFLERIENGIWDKWPFNKWCDHYMITIQKPIA